MDDVAAVIWDMDGTLLDSVSVVPEAFIATVRRLGGHPPDADGVVALYGVGEPRLMLAEMLGREGTEDDADLYHRVLAELAPSVVVHDGVPEVLEELRRRGTPTAVFTGNSSRAAGILLESTGLRPSFDAVVGGDEVARPKPAPDGVLAAARALGVDPARCAYIGDSPTDVGAAVAAGVLPIAAGWGHLYDATLDVATARTPDEVLALVGTGRA